MKMMNLCGAALCVLAVAACADRMNQTSNTAGSDSGYSSTSRSPTGYGIPATAPARAPATAWCKPSTRCSGRMWAWG
jgi:hypothetical protein